MAKKPQDNKDASPKQARYERVKQILNEASGDACPSYQGYEKFWELPLEEFLRVTIYGVRMIAPEEGSAGSSTGPAAAKGSLPVQSSCCHSPSPASDEGTGGHCQTPSDDKKHSSGRGEKSGLIIGLKGQFPFDGSQFPRLPWGGKQVSDTDIKFIQDWIDDGCPADDGPHVAVQIMESEALALARGDKEHTVSQGTINDFHTGAGTVKVRKNVNFLTPEELSRFRNAITCMRSFDQYFQDERSFNYWGRMHGNLCQHAWEEFLTWHRLYLYNFEQQLQDFDPTVTLPYWDWTDNANADAGISVIDQSAATPQDNGVIPEAYRCWLDQDAFDRLKKGGQVPQETLDKLSTIIGRKFNSGNRLFVKAGIKYGQNKQGDDAIMAELLRVNPLWHRKRWPGGDSSIIFEMYPTESDIDNILKITNFFAFGSGPDSDHFFGACENIHNLIHNFSGGANPNYDPTNPNAEPQYGDMVAPGTTAFDPIFWGHHSNVDRVWADWQTLHPGSGPDNPTAILAPWPQDVQQTYNITNLGYEYLKSAHVYETNSDTSITKFKSAKAGVHPAVLNDHSHAEVRLHKIRYAVNGGAFIRVFLNSPDASADTPTKGNDNYVGTAALFSGGCIGGPGHCDPPPERRRKFDHRGRGHKTPRNVKLDATETVRRLTAKGATDLHVSLVVLDIDGKPKSDALWMDAVSLIFKD